MTKLSRRSFLFAASATTLAMMLPVPAAAAPTKTITLDLVAGSDGVHRLRIPTDFASEIGAARTAEVTAASNRALKIAQAQNLSRPKANGLLTRLVAPALKGRPSGIAQALLQTGLVLGITVALSTAVADLAKDSSQLTMESQACAVMPPAPSSGWDRATGIYRNAAGTGGTAIQRTVVQSTSAGTVAAPAGWSWSAQRLIGSSNGVYTWEVIFSRAVACGVSVPFPPVTSVQGAIPNAAGENSQVDQNSDANRIKIADGLHNEAKLDAENGVSVPGGEVAGVVEEPGIPIPAAATLGTPDFGFPAPAPLVGNDYISPRAPIGADDTHVVFPPDVQLGGETEPGTEPTPEPTPGTGEGTTIDWGAPPVGSMPGVPTPFSWVPTPWAAPSLPGQCTGVPYNFSVVFRGASGMIDPCPVLVQARPVVRPVAIAGWTVYGISQFLDL